MARTNLAAGEVLKLRATVFDHHMFVRGQHHAVDERSEFTECLFHSNFSRSTNISNYAQYTILSRLGSILQVFQDHSEPVEVVVHRHQVCCDISTLHAFINRFSEVSLFEQSILGESQRVKVPRFLNKVLQGIVSSLKIKKTYTRKEQNINFSPLYSSI